MTAPLPFPLRPARMHEAFGPAAPAFAAILAATRPGPALWIRPAWEPDQINPAALSAFLPPERLLIAQTRQHSDTLAVAEDALRDGALALVILRLTRPLTLREGRRLQLAAGAGASTGLGLIDTGIGSNATETRWLARPVFDPTPGPDVSTLMQWSLKKNKSGTTGDWHVRWDRAACRLTVVSPARE